MLNKCTISQIQSRFRVSRLLGRRFRPPGADNLSFVTAGSIVYDAALALIQEKLRRQPSLGNIVVPIKPQDFIRAERPVPDAHLREPALEEALEIACAQTQWCVAVPRMDSLAVGLGALGISTYGPSPEKRR
jgi:hypothetical protein